MTTNNASVTFANLMSGVQSPALRNYMMSLFTPTFQRAIAQADAARAAGDTRRSS
jgi:hypothetical protein